MINLPTEDKELKERLVRMFDNATECFEWTTSKKIVHERHELVVGEILKEFEKRGYHKGMPNWITNAKGHPKTKIGVPKRR